MEIPTSEAPMISIGVIWQQFYLTTYTGVYISKLTTRIFRKQNDTWKKNVLIRTAWFVRRIKMTLHPMISKYLCAIKNMKVKKRKNTHANIYKEAVENNIVHTY